MADFFTDSDDEKVVEELLSQAMDSTVLEQVSAINCAGFTHSDLPSHLEARLQKLKSFPSSTVKPTSLSSKTFHHSHPPEFRENETVNEAKAPDLSEEKNGENNEKVSSMCSTKSPEEKSDSGSVSPFKKIPQRKFQKKGTKSPSFSSSDGSVSPPLKIGCFLCSPKKVSRKKNKQNRGLDLGLDDEFLSDVSNFSVTSQRKMIKKAMEEEEKICREAEKIVKWAKHASARMDVSGIEDELSDEENLKFH